MAVTMRDIAEELGVSVGKELSMAKRKRHMTDLDTCRETKET